MYIETEKECLEAVTSVIDALGVNGWCEPYCVVWDSIRHLAVEGGKADLAGVRNELVRRGHLERIANSKGTGVQNLADLVQNTPTMDAPRWLSDLTKIRGRIKASGLADEVKGLSLRGEPVDDKISDLYLAAAGSEEKKKKPPGWREAMRCEVVNATELAGLVDEPIPYVIWPLVVRGSMTQVQGLPKGGKSAFDVYLALCASTGKWPYPQHIMAEGPLKVLYIAWEDPKIMMAKRLSLYAVGLGFDRKFMPTGINFLFGPDLFVDRAEGVRNLKAAIAELQPDLVVIDTLSHIHTAEENSATEMKIPMRALDMIAKETNVGMIYLHHTNKGSGENGKATQSKGRGSGAIAAAWHVLVDWGEREDDSNVNPITVMSKFEHQAFKWNITYNASKNECGVVDKVDWIIESREEDEGSEMSDVVLKVNRIIKASLELLSIGDGWFTAYEMAEKCGLGLDSKSIKRHMQKLCEAGRAEFREGKAGIPHKYRAIMGGNLE